VFKNAVLLDRLKVHSMVVVASSTFAFHLYAEWQPVMALATSGIMQQLLPDVHASRHFKILFCSGSDF